MDIFEKKTKPGAKKDAGLFRLTIMVFAALCIVVGFLCFGYYIQLQDTIKTEGRGYMQEISSQMGTNVNKSIEDKYGVLGTMAAVLKQLNVDTYEEFQTVMQEQQELWDYQKVLLIDQNGVAYDTEGSTVALTADQYLQDVVVGKEASLSASQVIDGEESIIFSIPLEHVQIEGTDMMALAVAYELSTFDRILAMTAFDGKGYAHIIQNDGTVVVRSSSENALKTGYNILNSLSEAQFHDGKKIDEIKAEIAQGGQGQAEFTFGESREYMTYTPLGDLKWSLLTFVPTSVVNSKSNILLNITLLMCGFITILFALLLAAMTRTYYRHKRKLEQIAYVDPVTGGNTIERFYELAHDMLEKAPETQYALVYTNIEKFKVLNEQSGTEACDEILCGVEYGISQDLDEGECLGRLFADNFCLMVKYTSEDELSARFERWYQNGIDYVEQNGNVWLPLILEFGVYVITGEEMPFAHMIDRAKLALNETAKEFHGKMRYAIYDEQVRRILFREKQLEDWMEDALTNGEFQVYLQPKYLTETEMVGGAEALVRWKSSRENMIFPDEFISLFEKNGFIIQLDFYVFEEVCKTIRRWIDDGVTPIKVSVNCSRLHLRSMGFLEQYQLLADKYQVPHSLLEIEVTENTVFEDVGHLPEIIGKIRDAGFGCSMDDFGSGFSSLNLLQDIPVDTLKLDKIFFRPDGDLARSEAVVSSILTMSKALFMETVAEGVEIQVQVEMLKRLGCNYIQGYYYAKPMPITEFEQLAYDKIISV